MLNNYLNGTEHELENQLVAIDGDSTNLTTGCIIHSSLLWIKGVIQYLEKKLGIKLIWIICALHTNELPLRHLMIALDGKTESENRFSEKIGQLINKAMSLPFAKEIPQLDTVVELLS